MKKGFMEWVRGYIEAYPGKTAKEYAQDAYNKGYVESDAKKKVLSLATTLMKQVRNGNEPHIRRERIRSRYRYFPC